MMSKPIIDPVILNSNRVNSIFTLRSESENKVSISTIELGWNCYISYHNTLAFDRLCLHPLKSCPVQYILRVKAISIDRGAVIRSLWI